MELTSGESFYQLSNIHKPKGNDPYKGLLADFRAYLDAESDGGSQWSKKKSAETPTGYKGVVENAVLLAFESKFKDVLATEKAIGRSKHKVMNEIRLKSQLYSIKVLDEQKFHDSKFLRLVLEYHSILNREMNLSKSRLTTERVQKEILLRQEALVRDLRFFACNLSVETKGKVNLTLLHQDSPQFERCVKAVLDNINTKVLSDENLDSKNIKVLNVMKLQNTFLSNKLQSSAQKISAGKIKGLFCCLSKEHFYRFSSLGLYAQNIPQKEYDLKKLSGSLFSSPWFCASVPVNLEQHAEVQKLHQVSGMAAKLVSMPPASPLMPRFSRYSYISNMKSFRKRELEDGIFLALCRVLILNQKTIDGAINEDEIDDALKLNYDALYSSETEEYVLLQPAFVLPEFFMHAEFPSAVSKQASSHVPSCGADSPYIDNTYNGAEDTQFSHNIPAMLLASPGKNRNLNSASVHEASSSSSSPPKAGAKNHNGDADSCSVWELLTKNQISGHGSDVGGTNIRVQDQGSAGSDDPMQTLIAKQALVMSIQETVVNFKRRKQKLTEQFANSFS